MYVCMYVCVCVHGRVNQAVGVKGLPDLLSR